MRLIDADALEKEIKEKDIMGGLNYRWYIQNAPTVDVLEQIKAEIEQNAYPIVHGVNNHEKGMTLYGTLQIIDKYR